MAVSLTPAERSRVRDALGYMNVSPASSLHFGTPRPTATAFLVETAMDNILPDALERVRALLARIEATEQKIADATCQLSASRVGDVELRGILAGETITDALEREYTRWCLRLADVLGCPVNMYAERFRSHFNSGVSSISVGRR